MSKLATNFSLKTEGWLGFSWVGEVRTSALTIETHKVEHKLMATPLQVYLSRYADSHTHPLNVRIHQLCVPAIMWSVLGMADSMVLPLNFFSGFTLAHVVIFFSLIFYSTMKSIKLVVMMSLVSFLMLMSFALIPNLFWTSLIVFILAWIGQFYGHKVEGKKPSFFEDLFFLLIGPVWVLKKSLPRDFL